MHLSQAKVLLVGLPRHPRSDLGIISNQKGTNNRPFQEAKTDGENTSFTPNNGCYLVRVPGNMRVLTDSETLSGRPVLDGYSVMMDVQVINCFPLAIKIACIISCCLLPGAIPVLLSSGRSLWLAFDGK
ncbi:hypothetical protein CO704_24990 (plasmid) [Cedecea neteri]|uniref:Uncharacterized protein n=1 Tax=Cedecea neteri TaxID=158822 RepID=A0A291E5M0_9ENTR|nr:hypothetical protein CO704_24990 [Cedecea neteri]